MMDKLRELVDRWRESPVTCDYMHWNEGDKARRECADELEAALPRWIPVSERLPDDRQEVLAFVPLTHAIELCRWRADAHNWDVPWSGTLGVDNAVSHWMPLPSLPEDK